VYLSQVVIFRSFFALVFPNLFANNNYPAENLADEWHSLSLVPDAYLSSLAIQISYFFYSV